MEPLGCRDPRSSTGWQHTVQGAGVRLDSGLGRDLAVGAQSSRLNLLDFWLAVQELKLSYHNSDTMLYTIWPYYGNLISVPWQQPSWVLMFVIPLFADARCVFSFVTLICATLLFHAGTVGFFFLMRTCFLNSRDSFPNGLSAQIVLAVFWLDVWTLTFC